MEDLKQVGEIGINGYCYRVFAPLAAIELECELGDLGDAIQAANGGDKRALIRQHIQKTLMFLRLCVPGIDLSAINYADLPALFLDVLKAVNGLRPTPGGAAWSELPPLPPASEAASRLSGSVSSREAPTSSQPLREPFKPMLVD